MRMLRRAMSLFRGRQQGQVVYIVAIAMTVLMGFLALIIDVGLAYAERRQMQNAADGAAEAAARVIAMSGQGTTDADVEQAIDTYVALNGGKVDYAAHPPYYVAQDGSPISPVGAGGNIPTGAEGVSVLAENLQPVRTFFASLLGHPLINVGANAAALSYAGQMPASWPGLAPLTVPQGAVEQSATQLIWGPQYSQFCSNFGYNNVPADMKGILDFNSGAGPNYQQGVACGNKPNCVNGWTQNGFDGTIGTGDWIAYENGNLGNNVASALTTRLTNQNLSDGGGAYGILYLPVWDNIQNQPNIGTAFHITAFAAFKVYVNNVAGSAATGQFISWVVPGGQIDSGGGTTNGPRVLRLVPAQPIAMATAVATPSALPLPTNTPAPPTSTPLAPTATGTPATVTPTSTPVPATPTSTPTSIGTATPTPSPTATATTCPAPTISGVSFSPVGNSGKVTVAWTTAVAADSRVDWGTTPSYGSSVTDSTLSTSHSLQLSGISQGTVYYYQITSNSACGQSAQSAGTYSR